MMAAAVAYANAMGWTRLEVSTPPLPAFVRSLAFYQREGFAVTGGEKLKLLLST
ncbi:GNAT superfamily N-acetyltransferase [Paenibacillus sp. OAS669]|nr:GNAT superfamily N-acetyltransferase [Paenibacillus sp. OAS669]